MTADSKQRETAGEQVTVSLRPTAPRLPPSGLDVSPGTLIDRNYRVLQILGSGAMGIVALARDEVLERDVAVKVIRPELADHPTVRDRFLAEARAMARVGHPNVVQVHAYGVVSGSPYFVMEYVEGPNLEQWLEARGALPSLGEALGVTEQVCAGVSAIHASGTTHRDLKTSNVMVGPAFRLAVADLGLARLLRHERAEPGPHVSGTPAYVAPEVILGHRVPEELRTRADVYSIGVIAYEVLTGHLPFESDSVPRTLQMHVSEPPLAPSHHRPELPAAIDDVLARALAKDPTERTESAEDLARELRDAYARAHGAERPLRFLVADDDEGFRGLVARVLGKAFPGSVVEPVEDGEAGLRAAEAHPPSLALLDLDMPGLNGIELTAALRAPDATREVPVIVSTAVGGPADWRLLSRLGAQAFLIKPYDLLQLVSAVEAVVGRRAKWYPSSS